MYLSEVPEQDLWDIVNINVGAVTSMCRMVVKQMQERKKGAIVNVSSGSELQPLPLMTVYAATKVNEIIYHILHNPKRSNQSFQFSFFQRYSVAFFLFRYT